MRTIQEIIAALHPAKMKKVLIIGAAFVDVVIKVNALPSSGGDHKGVYEGAAVGGCAFNVADVLHKLKLPFDVFMPIGVGTYADIVSKTLRQYDYPVRQFKSEYQGRCLDNGWCLSLVEPNGERSFITMEGIENKLQAAWFSDIAIEQYDYIYISGYQMESGNGEVLLEVLQRKKAEAKIIFDPGPRGEFLAEATLRKLLDLNVVFTLNKAELAATLKINDLEIAAKKLYNLSQNPVVVTLGAQGALLVAQDTVQTIAGCKVAVVDTIGAGDAHTGGIIAGLGCGLSLAESVCLGNSVAAHVTAHLGAACAPTREQAAKMMENN